MNDKLIVEKLREILEPQIKWYEENKKDEGLVYDEMFNQFNDLSRGEYLEIIQILVGDL